MAISQSDFLVKVVGITGYFATSGGGDVSSDTTDVFNGGEREPEKLAGRAVTANVTVDRPYDPASHSTLLRDLRKKCGGWRTTVSKQAIDETDQPIGDPEVYPNALLVGVTGPETDASSNSEARLGLEFAVRGIA